MSHLHTCMISSGWKKKKAKNKMVTAKILKTRLHNPVADVTALSIFIYRPKLQLLQDIPFSLFILNMTFLPTVFISISFHVISASALATLQFPQRESVPLQLLSPFLFFQALPLGSRRKSSSSWVSLNIVKLQQLPHLYLAIWRL